MKVIPMPHVKSHVAFACMSMSSHEMRESVMYCTYFELVQYKYRTGKIGGQLLLESPQTCIFHISFVLKALSTNMYMLCFADLLYILPLSSKN